MTEQRSPFTSFELRDIPPGTQHWRELFDSRFLRVYALQGKPRICRIEGVRWLRSANKDESETKLQPALKLSEFEKPLVMNITNSEMLEQLHGADPSAWIGKRIEIYPTKTRFGRDMVDCIRVRDRVPGETASPNGAAKRAKAELSDVVKRHLDSMAAAQDADQLDACSEALVADDTLTESETTFLGKALEKRRGQLREVAT